MKNLFSKKLEEQAKQYMISQYPFEGVGLFTKDLFIPLTNTAADKKNSFAVNEAELLAFGMENIKAIIHSHPTEFEPQQYPSALDMQSQINFNIPFGIVSCNNERAYDIEYFGDSVPKAPLVGRHFIHGIQDCYSLIRDYYEIELNIHLLEFPRNWNWWEDNACDLYMQFEKTGFYEIPFSQMKKGDFFIMPLGISALRRGIANHGGIYLGNDTILHHKAGKNPYDTGQLSVRENIYRYSKYFTKCLRHKDNNR